MFFAYKAIVCSPKPCYASPKRPGKRRQRMKESVINYLVKYAENDVDKGKEKTIKDHVLRVQSKCTKKSHCVERIGGEIDSLER